MKALTKIIIALPLIFAGTIRPTCGDDSNRYGFSIHKVNDLTVLECVHILNEFTHFQVNCEMPLAYSLPQNHSLDINLLDQNTGAEAIEAIVRQDPDYSMTVTGNTINITWNRLPRDTTYLLNHPLPEFVITNGDVADVFSALRKKAPTLLLSHPFHMGRMDMRQTPTGWIHVGKTNDPPVSQFDHQTYGGQPVHFQLTNTTVRNVLLQTSLSQSNHMYWASEFGSTRGAVYISLYTDSEHMGRKTIQGRQPKQ